MSHRKLWKYISSESSRIWLTFSTTLWMFQESNIKRSLFVPLILCFKGSDGCCDHVGNMGFYNELNHALIFNIECGHIWKTWIHVIIWHTHYIPILFFFPNPMWFPAGISFKQINVITPPPHSSRFELFFLVGLITKEHLSSQHTVHIRRDKVFMITLNYLRLHKCDSLNV